MLDIISFLKAIFLGIIEGLTEFIPVSSTAHLVIFSQIINFTNIQNNVFEIAIQIGGISAVLWVFRVKIFAIISGIANKINQNFILNILIAFLPAIIIGLIAHDFIKEFLFSNFVIALSLIFGGIIIIFIEKKSDQNSLKKVTQLDLITKKTAFKIGLCQCLAMIPGVSRSGATIIGAMFLGVSRNIATEFSFFLAIPTIGSASIYEIYQNLDSLKIADLQLILIGTLSSFFSGVLVIKWLIKFVSNHNFIIFGYYRIIIGLLILYWTL